VLIEMVNPLFLLHFLLVFSGIIHLSAPEEQRFASLAMGHHWSISRPPIRQIRFFELSSNNSFRISCWHVGWMIQHGLTRFSLPAC